MYNLTKSLYYTLVTENNRKMAYYSIAFLGFVLIFILLHHIAGVILPRYLWIVRLLAGVSFFIYLSGSRIIFIGVSALTVWYGSILIDRLNERANVIRKREDISKEEKKRLRDGCTRTKKAYAAAIVIFNLGLLILVKYIFPVVSHPIALPIGISFYTLMAISYTIDVYGEKYAPQTNFAKVMLYLCWFPQLIQGPINRYELIEHDLYRPYTNTAPEVRYAIYLFLFGAVKKYAIADLLAPLVNASLNDASSAFPGSYLLFGAVMFAIEQYADFSGGIDMSMAVSLLFGVKMNENFRQPYFSTSLAQFWRRWHITLGSFMRDYVFYPFATAKPIINLNKSICKRFGNHAGRSVIGGIANIIVFALVGLWHGHETHYLFWGLYNGMIIALSDAASPLFTRLNAMLHISDESKGLYVFRVIRTFMIVTLAGYFDVIGPVRTGISCFVNTFLHFDPAGGTGMIRSLFSDGVTSVQAVVCAALAVALLLANSVHSERGGSYLNTVCAMKFYRRWGIFFLLLMIVLYSFTVSSGIRGFMYAAF